MKADFEAPLQNIPRKPGTIPKEIGKSLCADFGRPIEISRSLNLNFSLDLRAN